MKKENGSAGKGGNTSRKPTSIKLEYEEPTKKRKKRKHIHQCKVCLLIFPSSIKLQKHRQIHLDVDDPYKCKQCKESFKILEDLVAHLKVHKGEQPYVCKKCHEGFWDRKEYEKHIPIHVLLKIKTTPKQKFQCDLCDKAFAKLSEIERHTLVHTGEKPHSCKTCGKGFQQKHNLNKHMLTHGRAQVCPCDICNKHFSRPDVLARHLLTHAVEKPFKCSWCSKSFIRQTQLEVHVKHKHSEYADDTGEIVADTGRKKSRRKKTKKTPRKCRVKVEETEEDLDEYPEFEFVAVSKFEL